MCRFQYPYIHDPYLVLSYTIYNVLAILTVDHDPPKLRLCEAQDFQVRVQDKAHNTALLRRADLLVNQRGL